MPNLIFMIFLWRLEGILDFFYKLQKETHRMLLEILEIHIKQDFFSSKENTRIYRHHRSQEPHTQRTTCHPNSQFP